MNGKYNLNFTKMVASGNDFIVIDNKNGELDTRKFDYPDMARDICRRQFSVGADGLLVLEKSSKADFRMRIINSDGSEADMCGNGARCSAYYAYTQGWGDDLKIQTGAGIIFAGVKDGSVRLKMSDPKDVKLNIKLPVGQKTLVVHHVNTGVPHAIHFVDDIEKYDVKNTGRSIRQHEFFKPAGTNVNFVGSVKASSATLRTYERGVEDETLACGTGTVASAIMLGLVKGAKSPVRMKTKGGDTLTVHYKIAGKKITDVYLEGGAKLVFEGKL